MRAKVSATTLIAASFVLALVGASEAWAWGSGGGGAPPPSDASNPQPGAASRVAPQGSPQILSQLAEARRRAAQLRAQTDSLKAVVARRVDAIRQAPNNAAYVALQSAVASAAPGIESNLAALLRIGNTLSAEVSR